MSSEDVPFRPGRTGVVVPVSAAEPLRALAEDLLAQWPDLAPYEGMCRHALPGGRHTAGVTRAPRSALVLRHVVPLFAAGAALSLVVGVVVAIASDVGLVTAWGSAALMAGALVGFGSTGYLDRAVSVQDAAVLAGHRPSTGADRSVGSLTALGAFLLVGLPLVVLGGALLSLA